MNFQSSFKLLLATAAAACCVSPAGAQSVIEVTGDVQAFHGGWVANASEIGRSVTLDFAYDANSVTASINGPVYSVSSPITSADIAAGILGAGINLEADGPGTGIFTDSVDLLSGLANSSASTNVHAPSPGFSGDVYGFRLDADAASTSVNLIRDVYEHGHLDRKDSGTVALSNVSVVQIQAPEIDPASAASGLTLLLGGLAVARGRK